MGDILDDHDDLEDLYPDDNLDEENIGMSDLNAPGTVNDRKGPRELSDPDGLNIDLDPDDEDYDDDLDDVINGLGVDQDL